MTCAPPKIVYTISQVRSQVAHVRMEKRKIPAQKVQPSEGQAKRKARKERSLGQAADQLRVPDFRAIAQELSIRANHVLENLGVHDVSVLLSLTREDLVRAWSCGKKTIA